MIIPLSKEYRVRGTEHCWQLEKRRVRKDKHEWQAFKYFQTFGEAVGAACGREVRLHPASSLADALQAVDKIAARYNKLLDESLTEIEPGSAT